MLGRQDAENIDAHGEAIMKQTIGVWKDEGGASRSMPVASEKPLIGTPTRVEWAVQIKARVNAEFDRVANALESAPKSGLTGISGRDFDLRR